MRSPSSTGSGTSPWCPRERAGERTPPAANRFMKKAVSERGAVEGARTERRAAPTMRDVARHAGVSVATVTYVLNGLPGVSAERRKHVLAAIAELGFKPNLLARSLRRGHTKVLGLILLDIANPFYPEIAAGVIEAA